CREEWKELREKHPDRVGLYLGFNEGLAHVIEAGSDLFLMPSRYEPCGLNQIYSLRYGTPPVVRATGGLADTVVNATEENLAAGTATGFSFHAYTPSALYETVRWGLRLRKDRPDREHGRLRGGRGVLLDRLPHVGVGRPQLRLQPVPAGRVDRVRRPALRPVHLRRVPPDVPREGPQAERDVPDLPGDRVRPDR